MTWLLPSQPYAVQAEAAARSHDRERYGYWCDPGLGKTATDLNDTVYAIHQDKISAGVVICPSYLKSTWRLEAERWQAPFPVYVWPDRVPANLLSKPHLVVFNYESAIASGGDYLEELLRLRPYKITLDESSSIKNFNGKWCKTIMGRFRPLAVRHRTLTGTPMTQSVMDLWSQLRFNGAISGMNPYSFRNRYCILGGFQGKVVKGAKNEAELTEIIGECAFRATKEDWAHDLPEKIYPNPLEFAMSTLQVKLYKAMKDEFVVSMSEIHSDKMEVYATHIANAFQKLSQLSRGFIIGNDGRVVPIMPPSDNPALRVARQAVETLVGKDLILAFHQYTVDMLSNAFKDMGCTTLRGGMSDDEIDIVKSSFNNDPSVKIMVAQLSVGARGHTLLGSVEQRCSTALFFENTFSLEQRLQAEDRIHRFGADRTVVYLDLVGSEMDRRVATALQQKASLARAVVDAVRLTR